MTDRTNELETDLTTLLNTEIEKEVTIRDKKFVELDEEVKQFKAFDETVTADLTKQREDHETLK